MLVVSGAINHPPTPLQKALVKTSEGLQHQNRQQMLAWSLVTAEMSSWGLPSTLGQGKAVVLG